MTNSFPANRIRGYLADLDHSRKFLFGLFSAQRAITLAEDSVNGFATADRLAIVPALNSCWNAASTNDFTPLAGHTPTLRDRLMPESDAAYGLYNSVTNDAIASLLYTIRCGTAGDVDSAYYAAETLFNLADLLLNRDRSEYVNDLAAAPITAYAARCIWSDLDYVRRSDPTINASRMRDQLIDEGHELSSFAN